MRRCEAGAGRDGQGREPGGTECSNGTGCSRHAFVFLNLVSESGRHVLTGPIWPAFAMYQM